MNVTQPSTSSTNVSRVTDEESGVAFSMAVTPAANVEEVLANNLDPENEVFEVQEINVGNAEMVVAFGRTQSYQ